MTTWIISDTHFGDASLVGAPPAAGKVARPFETVSQMDECLADLWNDHIAEGDRVLHAGQEPEYWLDRLAGRISALHLKDVSAGTEDWANPGEGAQDWARLATRIAEMPDCLLIVERDDAPDAIGFGRAALAHLGHLA